jgi:PAS domain S-box-containing protein
MNQVAKSLITHKNSERVLADLINTIPNPAFFRNPDGVFVGCNKAFADTMLGTGCENIVGQSIYDLPDIIPRALSDICTENDKNLLSAPGLQTHETAITCADGVKRDFLLSCSTFTDDDGTMAGIISVLLDLTDKNRAEKLLKDRTAELLKSND